MVEESPDEPPITVDWDALDTQRGKLIPDRPQRNYRLAA